MATQALPKHPMRRHDDHELSIQPVPRTMSFLERILIPAVVAAVTVFVGLMLWQIVEPKQFQPLTYDLQRVVEIDPLTGIETIPLIEAESDLIPSVYVGDHVPVIGAVCNTSGQDVKVAAYVSWNSLDPLGLNVDAGEGVNTIGPGCRALGPYRNPMPDEVVKWVTEQGEPRLFHISGRVTVTEQHGGTTTWATEAFWVVPRP